MSKRQHDDDPLASVAALERFGRETQLAANQIWSPFTPAIRHIVTMLSNKHSKVMPNVTCSEIRCTTRG